MDLGRLLNLSFVETIRSAGDPYENPIVVRLLKMNTTRRGFKVGVALMLGSAAALFVMLFMFAASTAIGSASTLLGLGTMLTVLAWFFVPSSVSLGAYVAFGTAKFSQSEDYNLVKVSGLDPFLRVWGFFFGGLHVMRIFAATSLALTPAIILGGPFVASLVRSIIAPIALAAQPPLEDSALYSPLGLISMLLVALTLWGLIILSGMLGVYYGRRIKNQLLARSVTTWTALGLLAVVVVLILLFNPSGLLIPFLLVFWMPYMGAVAVFNAAAELA